MHGRMVQAQSRMRRLSPRNKPRARRAFVPARAGLPQAMARKIDCRPYCASRKGTRKQKRMIKDDIPYNHPTRESTQDGEIIRFPALTLEQRQKPFEICWSVGENPAIDGWIDRARMVADGPIGQVNSRRWRSNGKWHEAPPAAIGEPGAAEDREGWAHG